MLGGVYACPPPEHERGGQSTSRTVKAGSRIAGGVYAWHAALRGIRVHPDTAEPGSASAVGLELHEIHVGKFGARPERERQRVARSIRGAGVSLPRSNSASSGQNDRVAAKEHEFAGTALQAQGPSHPALRDE